MKKKLWIKINKIKITLTHSLNSSSPRKCFSFQVVFSVVWEINIIYDTIMRGELIGVENCDFFQKAQAFANI